MRPGIGLGPVLFGMLRHEARIALGRAGFPLLSSRAAIDYYCSNALQVEYTTSGIVQFIGVACDPALRLRYRGSDVFTLSAEESFLLFAQGEASSTHTFDQGGYCFPQQIITVWDADSQYDHITNQSRVVWGQVGLGSPTYLKAAQALTSGV